MAQHWFGQLLEKYFGIKYTTSNMRYRKKVKINGNLNVSSINELIYSDTATAQMTGDQIATEFIFSLNFFKVHGVILCIFSANNYLLTGEEVTTDFETAGTPIPEEYRPAQNTTVSFGSFSNNYKITINNDGSFKITNNDDSIFWQQLSIAPFIAKWTVAGSV